MDRGSSHGSAGPSRVRWPEGVGAASSGMPDTTLRPRAVRPLRALRRRASETALALLAALAAFGAAVTASA